VEVLEGRQYLALIVDSFPNVVVDPGTPTSVDVAFHAEGSTWYPADGIYGTAYDQDATYNVTFEWNPHDPSDTLAGAYAPETIVVTVPAGHALGHASIIHSYSESGSHPVGVTIDGPYGPTEWTPPDSVTGDSSEEPVPTTSGSGSASVLVTSFSVNRLRLGTHQTRRILGGGAFNLQIDANDPASTAAGGIGPVTVNWGDGSSPQEVSTYGPGVDIPHTYTSTGNYTISASTVGSGYGGMSASGLSFDGGLQVGATIPSSSASWRAMAHGSSGSFVAVAPSGDAFLLSIFGSESGGGGAVSFAALGTDVQATPSAVSVLDDGRILVAGDVLLDGHFSFALARFNADGSTDTSFGTAGLVTTSFGTSIDARANAIAIDPTTGDITLAGFAGADIGVARYTAEGARTFPSPATASTRSTSARWPTSPTAR
jgi:hypothetical protein